MKDFRHVSVLLQESVEHLHVKPGEQYIDGTIGGGGHAREIVERGGVVLGIDLDEKALEYVGENFKFLISNEKLKLVHGNFRDVQEIALASGFDKVDGILLDLGVSSYQIDQSGRGFSFLKDEPLDMRMSEDQEVSAFEIVNQWQEEEIEAIISRFGEEEASQKIARAIIHERSKTPIKTARELAQLIEKTVGGRRDTHPATRTFMALRIVVNDELLALRGGISGGISLLQSGGRLCILTFHSLEDRIVKMEYQKLERLGDARIITKKPITPTDEEIKKNRRARSAKLRVIEKV